MGKAPLTFTAVQIAAAIGLSKRGVQLALAGVRPAGEVRKRGGRTAAWGLEQLPEAWQATLAGRALQSGFRNGTQLLLNPSAPWQPQIDGAAVQLGDIAEHCIMDARRLQRALLPSLARLTGQHPAAAAEAEAKGLGEYRAAFGHAVSPQHWRRLLDRTINRAGAGQDFSRLEIFLSAKLARRVPAGSGDVATDMHLEGLRHALSIVGKPSRPSAGELVFIWQQAFDELQWLLDEVTPPKAAARAILSALEGSGVRLAVTSEALKKSFKRNLARWQEGGCKPSALKDGRSARAGVRLGLPEHDKVILTARAVENGGRISQAFREAQRDGELSLETARRFIGNPANKSHVPRAVRAGIRHDVALLEDIHHGPRQAKLNGPYIPRDYDDCGPGDWSQADDCTLPLYYWENTPEGIRGMRGQFLLMVDVKTSLILGFALHSERNYNAAIIRSLIVRTHDAHGLPRKGFYFEGGLWRRSRLLKGRAVDAVTLEETEMGLREHVRFMHARLPRAKIIEGVLGILQNKVEAMPGYVGRNEQTEKFERIQKQLLQATCGKIAHGSFLLSKAQWIEQLKAVCEQFNQEPQGGRLKGLSPLEAYEAGFDEQNPLTRLPANCRYLLANHCRREKVSRNGVRIVLRGEPYYFRNIDTGRLIGQHVLVFHDVEEFPQSITITDLHRRNAVEVPRVDPLPSMTATAEQLATANAQSSAHLAYARTHYRVIEPHFKRNRFRAVLVDAETRELGEQISAGRERIVSEKDKAQELNRRIAAKEREIDGRLATQHRNPERKLEGLERMQKFLEAAREETSP